jgi:hypothetical protein
MTGTGLGHLVELPGGLVRDGEPPLRQVELRPLRGFEEEWLARNAHAPNALAVTELLGACVARVGAEPPSRELVRGMLVGDRDFLVLELRRLTLGETVHAVLDCPACDGRMDVDFRAGEVPVERRPHTMAVHRLELDGSAGRARTVRFRLPTGADQEAVLEPGPEHAAEALLARCLVDDGGTALSAEELARVADAIEALAPQLELELELTCPECAHAFVTWFDLTAFFLDEIRGGWAQLLREVHHLAFHYHWSEAAILGLTRERRRAYLALLSEALQPD